MEQKPIAKAVALRYDPDKDTAPIVVAKGRGVIAEKVEQLARESGVPLREDQELVDYLMMLDLYEEIPEELYAVVAEVLAFIYRMNNEY